jgi:glc operon protein GlcG
MARHGQKSARFPFPTHGIEQLADGKDLKGGTVPGIAQVPGVTAFAGGLPILTEDRVHIGGIGVSGGSADQDETCAQAGIDAAKDALKWVPAIRSRKGGDTEGAGHRV